MSQYRTHNCGELRAQDAGKTVTLAGWMENLREVGGGVGFLVLRDFLDRKSTRLNSSHT